MLRPHPAAGGRARAETRAPRCAAPRPQLDGLGESGRNGGGGRGAATPARREKTVGKVKRGVERWEGLEGWGCGGCGKGGGGGGGGWAREGIVGKGRQGQSGLPESNSY
jgi:hypothetical protein